MLTDQEKKQLLDAVQVSVKDVQANLSGVSKQLKTIDIKTESVIDDVKEIDLEEKYGAARQRGTLILAYLH